MMNFFANIFGYLLNFIYNIIGNYGYAIIIFCIMVKIIMLPISIKQQKSMKASARLQKKMKEIQFKYKNDPEGLNRATMEMYREEKINPFSGCLSAILQIILIISVFYLVRSPLTYMKKIDKDTISKYKTIMKEEKININTGYPEIDIVREIGKLENNNEKIKKEEVENLKINMDFVGLDLSQIPSKNSSDIKVFIIPILYVITAVISTRLATATTNKNKVKMLEDENKSHDGEEQPDMNDMMNQMNKNMSLIMPVMYLSVALVAPLGLALYWLVNSILMIVERFVLNKVIKDEE